MYITYVLDILRNNNKSYSQKYILGNKKVGILSMKRILFSNGFEDVRC